MNEGGKANQTEVADDDESSTPENNKDRHKLMNEGTLQPAKEYRERKLLYRNKNQTEVEANLFETK